MAGSKKNRKAKSLDVHQSDVEKIALRLKDLRIKAGFTAAEKFANEFDLPRAQYARYEAGAADMRITSLLKIIRLHNINPSEFFKDFE